MWPQKIRHWVCLGLMNYLTIILFLNGSTIILKSHFLTWWRPERLDMKWSLNDKCCKSYGVLKGLVTLHDKLNTLLNCQKILASSEHQWWHTDWTFFMFSLEQNWLDPTDTGKPFPMCWAVNTHWGGWWLSVWLAIMLSCYFSGLR